MIVSAPSNIKIFQIIKTSKKYASNYLSLKYYPKEEKPPLNLYNEAFESYELKPPFAVYQKYVFTSNNGKPLETKLIVAQLDNS